MENKYRLSNRVSQVKASLTLAITSKVKAIRKDGIDVIGFGAGEPDFDTPANIKKAGIEAIKKGFTKYTPASGMVQLKEAVCKKLNNDNGLSCDPDEVVISCGAKHALYNIFQAICNPGDEVIVITPYWVSYPEMITLAGAKSRFVVASEENEFRVSPKDIEKAISPRTKAMIINSPSNPTGAVLSESALREIAQVAVSKNVYVISDEIYEKLIYDGEKHVSIAGLGKDIAGLTFTVNGVSKTYSMTGWRIGYAAGPAKIMKAISALQSHSTSNPSSISQAASLEALQGDQGALEIMKKEFSSRRDYMVKRINSLKNVSCVTPKGAFYVFCNIAGAKMDSVTFCERLLMEAHVACVPGKAFGSDSHIRFSFATSMDNIKNGLDRMGKWIEKI